MAAPENKSQKQRTALGLPEGEGGAYSVYSPFPFGGLASAASRIGIPDQKFWWIENLVKIGDANLRSVKDVGPALYTISGAATIVNFFMYNIGSTKYAAIFLSNGTAYQVNNADGTITTISSVPGTFYQAGSQLTACCQWAAQYLLISNNLSANSYWVWDGATLYTAGTLAPIVTVTNGGSGYTSLPTITVYGGSGTGASFTAILQNNMVTAVTMNTPGTGYVVGDQVQLGFSGGGTDDEAQLVAVVGGGVINTVHVNNAGSGYSVAPTITVVGGGGSGAIITCTVSGGTINTITITNGGSGYIHVPALVVQAGINKSAAATVTVMPYGVSGTTVETYQQRVWIANPYKATTIPVGNVFSVSTTGSISDFAPSDGGLLYTSNDATLRENYSCLKQTNGYLYPFGDSSVSVISGVSTSGNPPVTTFNYQNTDPQIGTPWRDTLQPYGRAIIFGNNLGIFGLYGGGVTKLSEEIDNIFINAVFPPTTGALTPSSAVATFYKRRLYLFLLTISDPFTGNTRNVMIGWDSKEFYILSQSTNLIYIGTQEINSQIIAWGTDGTSLFPLFSDFTSTGLPKILSTKLYGANSAILVKKALAVYIQATDLSGTDAGVEFSSITVDNEIGSYEIPNSVNILSAYPKMSMYPTGSGDVPGVNLGITLMSSSPSFSINHLMLGYLDWTGIFGSDVLDGEPEEE